MPETFSLSFSPLCLWIRGLFPAIEFAVVSSSSLPNSGDPEATLARAYLNAGDLTAAKRSGTAHSCLFPRSDPLRPIQIERLGPRVPLHARAPDALTHLPVPFAAAHHSRSNFPRPILIERFRPARTRSDPPRTRSDPLHTPRPPVAVHFPSDARPAWSAHSPPLSLTLPVPLVSARPSARAPSAAHQISAVGF
jgi:hypothetical protein